MHFGAGFTDVIRFREKERSQWVLATVIDNMGPAANLLTPEGLPAAADPQSRYPGNAGAYQQRRS